MMMAMHGDGDYDDDDNDDNNHHKHGDANYDYVGGVYYDSVTLELSLVY